MFFSIPQINREFDPHPLRREEFLQLQQDGKLIYGQLPLLEIDGLKLVQSQVAQHFFESCKDVPRKVLFFSNGCFAVPVVSGCLRIVIGVIFRLIHGGTCRRCILITPTAPPSMAQNRGIPYS